jgi:hypothetical protein
MRGNDDNSMIVIRNGAKRGHGLGDVRPRDSFKPQAIGSRRRLMLVVARNVKPEAGSWVDEYEFAHKSVGIVEPPDDYKTSVLRHKSSVDVSSRTEPEIIEQGDDALLRPRILPRVPGATVS